MDALAALLGSSPFEANCTCVVTAQEYGSDMVLGLPVALARLLAERACGSCIDVLRQSKSCGFCLVLFR